MMQLFIPERIVIFSMYETISGYARLVTLQILIIYPGHNQIYFFIFKGHSWKDRYN